MHAIYHGSIATLDAQLNSTMHDFNSSGPYNVHTDNANVLQLICAKKIIFDTAATSIYSTLWISIKLFLFIKSVSGKFVGKRLFYKSSR